jgi:protein-S-isoprenylcysteine O-methyltransferase Ste14
MKSVQTVLYNLPRFLLSSVASVLTIVQIILALLVHGSAPYAIQWTGWVCIWISGILGLLPIFAFRRKGGVPDGESYMKTTALVETGLYAVVRHPQGGTAWLLINVGVMLLAWHWSNVVLGLVSMALVYADTFKADQYCIQKFGPAYERYIARVPRVNVLVGLLRLTKVHGNNQGT